MSSDFLHVSGRLQFVILQNSSFKKTTNQNTCGHRSELVVKSNPTPTPTPRVRVVDFEGGLGIRWYWVWVRRMAKRPEYLYEFRVWWQLWREGVSPVECENQLTNLSRCPAWDCSRTRTLTYVQHFTSVAPSLTQHLTLYTTPHFKRKEKKKKKNV